MQITPKITVIGVGGAKCNAVNNMIEWGPRGVNLLGLQMVKLANSIAKERYNLVLILSRSWSRIYTRHGKSVAESQLKIFYQN